MSKCVKRVDTCIPQHDDKQFIVDIYDDDGNLVDISSADITWIVSDGVRGSILLTKTTTGGAPSMTKASSTRVQWDVTSAESGALAAKALYHEMQITNSAGEKQTVMYGTFTVQDTRISD